MSYARRRNSVHVHFNGHRIRKAALWQGITSLSLFLLVVAAASLWTLYRIDPIVHQTISAFLQDISSR